MQEAKWFIKSLMSRNETLLKVASSIVQHQRAFLDHHYTTTFSGGRKPSLSPERQQLITMAVNEYGADDTKRAITGCSLSDWHMGRNPSGKKYTSIELILRDSEHIERFLQLTVAEDNKGGFLDD